MRWFSPAIVSLIAWGALAFGCEYAWAYAPLLVFAFTIGVLGLATPHPDPELRWGAVSLALIGAAVGLQLLPLPEPVVAAVSPARSDHDYTVLFAATVPTAFEADEAVGRGAWPWSISVSPGRTLLGLTFFIVFSLFFIGCRRVLGIARASGVVRGLIAVGVCVAVIALVQEASRSPLVYGLWWPRKVEALPAAPIINENHLAGWLVMAFSMAVGHLCGGVALAGLDAKRGWRKRLVWFGSRDGAEVLLAGLAALLMAGAVVLALSVSGIGCLVLVCLAFGWRVARRSRGSSRRFLLAGFLVAVPLAAASWVGVDAVAQELALASWSDISGRLPIWRDAGSVLREFPLAGTGLNTYGIAMLAYQTSRTDVHVVEAHNEYLQLAAEGGLLLGLPILCAVVTFARQVRRRFREAKDDVRIHWRRVGAVTGLGALAVQSIVDFSLQMPGNAVLFALLMAIAVHRPPPRRRRPRSEP